MALTPGVSFPTDPAAYDDDLSAFGGEGDPRYSVGGEHDAGREEDDRSWFERFKDFLGIESGEGSSIPGLGEIISQIQAASVRLGLQSGVAAREIFQGDYSTAPGYDALETSLWAQSRSMAGGQGFKYGSPEWQQVFEDNFELAHELADRGLSMEAIQRHVEAINPYPSEEGEMLPPEGFQLPGPAEREPATPMPMPAIDIREAIRNGSLTIRPAMFEGPGLQTFVGSDGGEVTAFVRADGRVTDAGPIVQQLASTIQSGGQLSQNQLALIAPMTPAQRAAAGIFLTRSGEVIPVLTILERAVQNAAAGKSLTPNQQQALGLVFLNTPNTGGAHRDLVNAIAGSASGSVRANISAAVQESLGVAIDNRRTANADTERQQRGTPGRITANAIGRLSEGKGLTANQQQLFNQMSPSERAALLDDAIAPDGRPNIVANIVARTAAGQRPTAAQREWLASLPPQQRNLVRTTAERAAVQPRATQVQRAVSAARQQATPVRAPAPPTVARAERALAVARQRMAAARAPIAAAAPRNLPAPLRTLPARQQQAILLQRAVSRREAGRALTPLQRTALAQASRGERQVVTAQTRAAQAAQAAQAEAARARASAQRLADARTAEQRRRATIQAAAQQQAAAAARRAATTAQRVAEARSRQQAAAQRAREVRAPIAAVAPRARAAPLRTLPAAQQQRVLVTRAASREQAGVPLTARQRQAQQQASAAARTQATQQAQAAARAAAAQQAARTAAQRAAQRAEQARVTASAARRAAVAPRSTGPLRNLSAAEQQRVLLTRAVARRQAGVALTPAQLAALKASTARQRAAVR